LMDLVRHFCQEATQTYPKQFEKPLLLFLATDTAYLVPTIVNATRAYGVSTVVLPQIRVKPNEGVTFKALAGVGEKCLLGWQAMVSDMLLLSYSDVLIAARHSSFSQSLPLSLVFDRHATNNNANREGKDEPAVPRFCEVSETATSMTCLPDLATWLFRDKDSEMITYSLNNTSESTSLTTPVLHKLLVLLPDIEESREYLPAVKFLTSPHQASSISTHTYGNKRFNPRYRLGRGAMLATFTIDAASQYASP
jgi:hypothetical protein